MDNSKKETLKIWRIIDVINWGVDYLGKKSFDNPRLEIEIFLQHILNCEKIDLYRSKREASKCVENLYSLNIHNTPKSLRAYCLLFIYIYPLIFVPSIIANLKPEFELYNI